MVVEMVVVEIIVVLGITYGVLMEVKVGAVVRAVV